MISRPLHYHFPHIPVSRIVQTNKRRFKISTFQEENQSNQEFSTSKGVFPILLRKKNTKNRKLGHGKSNLKVNIGIGKCKGAGAREKARDKFRGWSRKKDSQIRSQQSREGVKRAVSFMKENAWFFLLKFDVTTAARRVNLESGFWTRAKESTYMANLQTTLECWGEGKCRG